MLLEEVPRRSQDFHDLWNYRSVYPRNVPGTSHNIHDLGMHEYSHVTRVPQWISQGHPRSYIVVVMLQAGTFQEVQ